MAPKKQKTVVKVKKKKWFPIYAPALFGEKQLGETYIVESADLNGKYITANLSTVTGSLKKQNLNMQFRVNKVEDDKGYTEAVGYSMINAALKRLVRRGRNKIIDSFLAKTKDKKVLRIKPMIITHTRGTNSVQSAVRLLARKHLREYAFSKSAEELFGEVADGKLQKQTKDVIAKIFPLRTLEIRSMKLDESGKVTVTDKEVDSEAVTIRNRDKGNKHLSEEELAAREAAKKAAEDALHVGGTSTVVDEEANEEESEAADDKTVDVDDASEQSAAEDASDEELEAELDDDDKKKVEETKAE